MPFKSPQDKKKRDSEYAKSTRWISSSARGRDVGKVTAACELFVAVDLLRRGFEVTRPMSPTAKHDLHVKLPTVGWVGVQVKAGIVNRKTNTMVIPNCQSVESPVLAGVHLASNRIEYRRGNKRVPKELL